MLVNTIGELIEASMGNLILHEKGLISKDAKNYAELMKKAYDEKLEKERLILADMQDSLRTYDRPRYESALLHKQVEEEEKRKKEENITNDAAIFHLIASDPEPAQEETKSPTLEQEHKNPRSRTDLSDGPLVPVDLINEMLVFSGWNRDVGHAAAPLVSTLFNSIKTQKDVRLKELLTAIVNGDRNIVEAMLERDPSLLLEKLDENDYITALSGQRSNNATAYRTALAVEDTQMAAFIKMQNQVISHRLVIQSIN